MLRFAVLLAPALILASCDAPPPVENAAAIDCDPTRTPADNEHAAVCDDNYVDVIEDEGQLANEADQIGAMQEAH